MLIVAEQAYARAKHMLDKLAPEPAGWRCLYLKPEKDASLTPGQIRALSETFMAVMQTLPGGVFFAENGHIFCLYKNELSPSQVFQLQETLRHQYEDETHRVEHIYMDDVKLRLADVRGRLEMLAPSAVAAVAPAIRAQKTEPSKFAGTVADRMNAFLRDMTADTLQQINQQRARRRDTVVLAVEDDPFYVRLIEKVFGSQARVVTACQAEQVLEEYIISAPNVVLMDIGLPEVSGHDLLKTILKMDPDAYVVMASGNSARDDVMGAISQGAKGFITKPFSRDKLIGAVSKAPTIKQAIT